MEGVRLRKSREKTEEKESEDPGEERKTQAALQTWSGFAIFGLFLLFLKLIIVYNQRLPTILTLEDEQRYPDRFIGARAQKSLLKLASLGPKLTGSYECEIKAVRLIREEISEIAREAKPVHLLQEDLQKPKGSFPVALKPHGFNSVYDNIQNFAVRIGPTRPSNHSILVNCHFDTVPDSPGASDNGLNCAVMLEVLRKLSQRSQPLKHNIIFLFNGAEEQFLQGAHGFITGHHWHKEVRVVINLDSAGAGGREFLFQASPDHPWILKAYAEAVPHPSATLAGQEVFESGLIPSDTDFRIFRDFGAVPGLDLAHGDNGYIYHTRLDTMDYIASGVYQHTGDNLLALLEKVSEAPELEDIASAKEAGARLVYYDLFNSYMVVYSRAVGYIVNLLVVALSFMAARMGLARLHPEAKTGMTKALLDCVIRNVAGAVTLILIIFLLDGTGAALSWYSRPYNILLLYVLPYVAAALLSGYWRRKSSGFDSALQQFFGGQMLTSLILLLMTLAGIRSSYLLMLVLLLPAISGAMLHRIESAKIKVLTLALASLLGTAAFFFSAISFYFLLLPIMGRSGTTVNPEGRIGGLTILMCLIIGNSLIPLLMVVKRPLSIVKTFASISAATIFLVVLTPYGFPYSATAPALQRFYIYHTHQNLYSPAGDLILNTSGIFVLPVDRNGMKYVTRSVPALQSAVPAQCSSDRLLCLFPLYNGRYVDPADKSVWLPFTAPQFQYPTSLKLLESNFDFKTSSRSIKLKIKGPDHITLVISPRSGVSLASWSLNETPQHTYYQERDYYVIFISDGMFGDESEIEVHLKANKKVTGPWLDVNIVGHYQHQKGTYTPEFAQFVADFPDWTQATAWLTQVNGHSF